VRHGALLLDERGRLVELSAREPLASEEVQGELQLHERARLAGVVDLTRGQLMPGVQVPELERDQPRGTQARQPQPAAQIAAPSASR